MDKTQDQKLTELINKKIDGWDRTRHNRLNASERLKKYVLHEFGCSNLCVFVIYQWQ